MSSPRRLAMALALTAACAASPAAASASVTIDTAARTVTTPRLALAFSSLNPEQIDAIGWRGGGNLVSNGGGSGCTSPFESWGQSYGDGGSSLVTAGSRGTWKDDGEGTVRIDSQVTASGCVADDGRQPVVTRYRFFDDGPQADVIAVTRTFGFASGGPTVLSAGQLRPYVPRMPVAGYHETLWPHAGALEESETSGCPFGCFVGGWDGTWYAQHNPAHAGAGLLVVRDPASVAANPARLIVDNDYDSSSNNSSADLRQPAGGWTGPVTETEYLCFYDGATWPAEDRVALHVPAWCGPPAAPGAPSDPAPVDPAPSDPAPADPAPVDPPTTTTAIAPVAPPAPPAPAPRIVAKASTPSITPASVVSLPSTRACVAGRTLRLRLKQPKGIKIASATIKVNNKLVKTVRGVAAVALRGLPKGRFTLVVTVRTASGAVVRDQRTYKACTAKR